MDTIGKKYYQYPVFKIEPEGDAGKPQVPDSLL
jgi:hypothetical protein